MSSHDNPGANPNEISVVLDEVGLIHFAHAMAAVLAPGDCVALRGQLGMGKTTFARALVRALLRDPALDVPSPTFALRQDYSSALGQVVHFDLYRISEPCELDELGFADALETSITVIEWPERAEADLPEDRFEMNLTTAPLADTRQVILRGYGAVADRAKRLAATLGTAS